MGKGEIARYEQFLLFPQCFQKASFPEASKGVIVWEWVNLSSANSLKWNLLKIVVSFNPLLNDKFLYMAKFKKAFADDKLNVAKMTFSL